MADFLNSNDFAKAILDECVAFEAKLQASCEKAMQLAQDNTAKFQAGNKEMQARLATPAAPG